MNPNVQYSITEVNKEVIQNPKGVFSREIDRQNVNGVEQEIDKINGQIVNIRKPPRNVKFSNSIIQESNFRQNSRIRNRMLTPFPFTKKYKKHHKKGRKTGKKYRYQRK